MDDLTIATATRPAGRISPEERTRRQAAFDYAYASARLEGFVPSDYAKMMNRRYIEGEITRAELSTAIQAHHGL